MFTVSARVAVTNPRASRGRVVGVSTTVVLVAALSAPGAVARAAAGPTCFGKAATIVGARPQPGVITRVMGTAGPDVIFSRWDDQFIYGLGGNDLLCGHAEIHGGRGDDRMRVRSEKAFLDASTLFGGPGDDTIHRDEALDEDPHFDNGTFGGPGHDRLYGSANLDFLHGGPGRDRMFGNGLRDELRGGRGTDVLVGGSHRDLLRGDAGSDRLIGKGHDDVVHGGPGNDVARGRAGDDEISGDDGTDVAFGGFGIDTCHAETAHCELP